MLEGWSWWTGNIFWLQLWMNACGNVKTCQARNRSPELTPQRLKQHTQHMGFKRYLILWLILSHACNAYPVDCGHCSETALCCKSPLCILVQLIAWSHLCFSDIALCVQGLSIGCDLPPLHWWFGCNMGRLVWQWCWMCREKKRTHPEMKSLTRDYGFIYPALNALLNFHLWEGYVLKGWLKLNQRWV